MMDEAHFDHLADRTLRGLVTALDGIDDLEVDLELGVLTISFEQGPSFVVNSHRAARQIWLAADRAAWHFDPHESGSLVSWDSTKAPREELHAALSGALTKRLGRPVQITPGAAR